MIRVALLFGEHSQLVREARSASQLAGRQAGQP